MKPNFDQSESGIYRFSFIFEKKSWSLKIYNKLYIFVFQLKWYIANSEFAWTAYSRGIPNSYTSDCDTFLMWSMCPWLIQVHRCLNWNSADGLSKYQNANFNKNFKSYFNHVFIDQPKFFMFFQISTRIQVWNLFDFNISEF